MRQNSMNGATSHAASARRCPRVVFASPEIYPLAKTGGLGDVSAALPAALESSGADLPQVMPTIAAQGAQFIVCGEGERAIEQQLSGLALQYPGRVAIRIGYKEALARRILAGADMLAPPARFEPCGLIQMYAMRSGTVPIVRRTGGHSETVLGDDSRRGRSGATGFVFNEPTAQDMSTAIERACRLYRQSSAWRKMQVRAMRQDFRWRRSAERYLVLYRELVQDNEEATARRGLGAKDYRQRPAV